MSFYQPDRVLNLIYLFHVAFMYRVTDVEIMVHK